jgi:hypothetical protein
MKNTRELPTDMTDARLREASSELLEALKELQADATHPTNH